MLQILNIQSSKIGQINFSFRDSRQTELTHRSFRFKNKNVFLLLFVKFFFFFFAIHVEQQPFVTYH